jgi:hypothetical protein
MFTGNVLVQALAGADTEEEPYLFSGAVNSKS